VHTQIFLIILVYIRRFFFGVYSKAFLRHSARPRRRPRPSRSTRSAYSGAYKDILVYFGIYEDILFFGMRLGSADAGLRAGIGRHPLPSVEETPEQGAMPFSWKPGPESGLACLMRAIFARMAPNLESTWPRPV